MIEDKKSALTGENNKRLNNMDMCNQMLTQPLVDSSCVISNANLTIPAEADIVHAKEWVDDGSRL